MAPGSELRRDRPAAGPVVQRLSADGFSIDGRIYRAVLLTPEKALAWDAPTLDKLEVGDVEPLLGLTPPPEFLVLGTGAAMAFPPRDFVRALEDRGTGVEAMDSRAAARTWSMLRGEERWIAAAIMPL